MSKAKKIIKRIDKEIEDEKSRKMQEEFSLKKRHSNRDDLYYKACEILSKKFHYMHKDFNDFGAEMREICKGVDVHNNSKEEYFLTPSEYGFLCAGSVIYEARIHDKERCIWNIGIVVPNLDEEGNYKDKLSLQQVSKLIKPEHFLITFDIIDISRRNRGKFDKDETHEEFKIPMDRYDLFFEKYVAKITRHVKQNLEYIDIKPISKKKKWFSIF